MTQMPISSYLEFKAKRISIHSFNQASSKSIQNTTILLQLMIGPPIVQNHKPLTTASLDMSHELICILKKFD